MAVSVVVELESDQGLLSTGVRSLKFNTALTCVMTFYTISYNSVRSPMTFLNVVLKPRTTIL